MSFVLLTLLLAFLQKKRQNRSTEDLGESGYYASESMIRESPKKANSSALHRYLTRSRSPGATDEVDATQKRHWSLSEMELPLESAEEITIHSSDESKHREALPGMETPDAKTK